MGAGGAGGEKSVSKESRWNSNSDVKRGKRTVREWKSMAYACKMRTRHLVRMKKGKTAQKKWNVFFLFFCLALSALESSPFYVEYCSRSSCSIFGRVDHLDVWERLPLQKWCTQMGLSRSSRTNTSKAHDQATSEIYKHEWQSLTNLHSFIGCMDFCF